MPDLLVLMEPMLSILSTLRDFEARRDSAVLVELRDVPGAPAVFVVA
jgi:hypothetical protein